MKPISLSDEKWLQVIKKNTAMGIALISLRCVKVNVSRICRLFRCKEWKITEISILTGV